ncbi:hypothetical protein [Bradyrhizobium sp. CCBAU 51753]|uniref:hypothetical protein n=1 Tax=Bradyrhizobium sp. CCBAU 51753 TaxID=1325100 RepID=UPI00188B88BF|nr:hypothetical protein [Bradyrhizobium sp. CCBAU 51753]QOZ25331.1 hypothetical protein XH93_18320 [Bradyrhizobium sp. CCBAU 51753]
MSAAETVMITRPRATEISSTGLVRQTFDVVNCPGITVVWEGFKPDAEGEFETVSQTYHLSTGKVFDSADEALLAWDAEQTDQEIVDALGEALLRYRHGLMRPLWADRSTGQKSPWIAAARSFRRLLNGIGFDIVKLERRSS